MKKGLCTTITYLLVLALSSCALSSCGKKNDVSVDGIVISEETPYSAQTQAYAEEVVFSLLRHYYQRTVSANLPERLQQLLRQQSQSITAVLAETPIAEPLYVAFLDKLSLQGKRVVDECCSFSDNGIEGLTATKSLYMELSTLLGSDYVGGILYDFGVYAYTNKYETAMADYEEYGYPHLLERAEQTLAEREVLQSAVGKDNFRLVLKIGFALSGLLLGEGFSSQQIAGFTDEEVLVFLRAMNLSALNVRADGWRLILSKALPTGEIAVTDSFALKAAKTLRKGEDLSSVASVLNETVSLLDFTVANMTATDAAHLRDGKMKELISSVFAKFGESEWNSFATLTTCSFDKAAYERLAEETYGEEYVAYREGVTVYTLAELKSSVGGEDFYNILRGYMAGISPFISYGMV